MPPPPLQVGSLIGDHRLVKKLGEGAMGSVFEGVHQLIGKRVAIKVLKGVGEEGRVAAKRLLEEARAVNAIGHNAHVVDIFDAGLLADGRPYLVMELLLGRSLHEEVKRTKHGLPMGTVFHLLRGVLDGLAAVHRAGVIHRDLKASNVFLVEAPRGPATVKLVDFGIARRQSRSEVLTMPSMTVGSLGFMAPEHLGGKPVPQSDLYAVGCLAWLMLTGKPVFPYGNPGVLARQHLEVKPPLVSTQRPDTTPELDAWVAWLLEKRPADRPVSAEVALTVLHEASLAAEGVRTAPGGPSFIELARQYDAGVRAEERDQTVLTTAWVPGSDAEGPQAEPPSKRQRAQREPASRRAPRVLTANRRAHESPDTDEVTIPPGQAPELGAEPDAHTVIETPSRRRR